MKTAVAQTSIEHYKKPETQEQFETDTQKVLRAIRVMGNACISEIAYYLRMDKSSVSGRLNELKAAGKVVEADKRRSKITGVKSECWRTETLFD